MELKKWLATDGAKLRAKLAEPERARAEAQRRARDEKCVRAARARDILLQVIKTDLAEEARARLVRVIGDLDFLAKGRPPPRRRFRRPAPARQTRLNLKLLTLPV